MIDRHRGVQISSPRARRRAAVVLTLLACAPAVVVGASGGAAAFAVALSRTPRDRGLATALAAVSTALGLLLVGAPLLRALVTGTSVAVGAAVVVVTTERLQRRRASRRPAPAGGATFGPSVIIDLSLGAIAGPAACVLLGAALMGLTGLSSPWSGAFTWSVGVGSTAYVAMALVALLRQGTHPCARRAPVLEHVVSWGLLALAMAGHAVVPDVVSLGLASLAGVLWGALRLPLWTVALQLTTTLATTGAVLAVDRGGPAMPALLAGTDLAAAASRAVPDLGDLIGNHASQAVLAGVVLVVVTVRSVMLAEQARAAAATELARHHERVLTGVLDGAAEQAIIATTPDLLITVFSAGAERMLGWSAAEVVGRPVHALVPPDVEDPERVRDIGEQLYARFGETGGTTPSTVWRRDGVRLEAMLSLSPQRSATGALEGHVTVLTDVTGQRAVEKALASSEQLFRRAFETAPTGLVLISLAPGEEGRVLRVNQTFAAFTGRPEAELLQLRVRDLLDPRDVDAHLTYLVRAAGGGEPEPLGVERRFTTPSGEVRHARKSTSVFRPAGEQPFLLAVIEDTTAQRAAEEALVRLAMHDPLTDLPNRALLADRLERALTADVRQRVGVTVVYIDLDGFKPVNDSHGHAAGDLLLKAVAERLSGAVRAGDTVARLGGDEFAVLCPGLGPEQVPVVLGRIARAAAPPVRLPGGAVVRVGLSTGTATAVGGADPGRLLEEADQAMFATKRRRRAERVAARADAERLAERIDERMAERAAERAAGTAPAPAVATTWAAPVPAGVRSALPSPAPSTDDLPVAAVADSSR